MSGRSSKDYYGLGSPARSSRTRVPKGWFTNGSARLIEQRRPGPSEVTGKVGSDVTAVTFDVDGSPVHATVADGFFATWWPTDPEQAEGGRTRTRTSRLTLRDGTQVTPHPGLTVPHPPL
jgi:hypothetical protein